MTQLSDPNCWCVLVWISELEAHTHTWCVCVFSTQRTRLLWVTRSLTELSGYLVWPRASCLGVLCCWGGFMSPSDSTLAHNACLPRIVLGHVVGFGLWLFCLSGGK
jgi:hypothetical protein